MATATAAELEAGGYHSKPAEEYLPTLNLPSAAPAGVLPVAERKPHLMAKIFFDRLQSRNATPFAQRLFSVVQSMEVAVESEDLGFQSPLQNSGPQNVGRLCAQENPSVGKICFVRALVRVLEKLNTSWEEAEDCCHYILATGWGMPAGVRHVAERSSSRFSAVLAECTRFVSTLRTSERCAAL